MEADEVIPLARPLDWNTYLDLEPVASEDFMQEVADLVANNTREFGRVEGLDVENWAETAD